MVCGNSALDLKWNFITKIWETNLLMFLLRCKMYWTTKKVFCNSHLSKELQSISSLFFISVIWSPKDERRKSQIRRLLFCRFECKLSRYELKTLSGKSFLVLYEKGGSLLWLKISNLVQLLNGLKQWFLAFLHLGPLKVKNISTDP